MNARLTETSDESLPRINIIEKSVNVYLEHKWPKVRNYSLDLKVKQLKVIKAAMHNRKLILNLLPLGSIQRYDRNKDTKA